MHPLRSVLAIGVAAVLSACFMSETPFIPEGTDVTLPEGKVNFCTSVEECAEAKLAEGGGYLLIPPPDEEDPPIPVRLVPLTENEFGQIWLGEFEMIEDDASMYVVGVLRRAPEFDGDLPAYAVGSPDCSELTDEEMVAYGIDKVDKATCALPAAVTVEDFLIGAFGEEMADPDWWAEGD